MVILFCYIPQGVTALNPLISIGEQLGRSARLSGADITYEDIKHQFGLYHLSSSLVKTYPAKLSGEWLNEYSPAMQHYLMHNIYWLMR